MKKLLGLLILTLLPMHLSFAAQDFYPFTNPHSQQRFQALTSQLRCLVCQNQNLAESNAPLANDLRNVVYKQILLNKSDPEIVAYLVARYGDFILYKPPLNIATLGLWFGPLLVLVAGLSYLIIYLRKNRSVEN